MFKTILLSSCLRCKDTAKMGDTKVVSPTMQEEKPIPDRKSPSGACTCCVLEPARVKP